MVPAVTRYGEEGWQLLEVKSSTKLKDYYREDLAIQVHLASRMGRRASSKPLESGRKA